MASEWFPEALESANQTDLGDGIFAPVINAVYFLATKLEAFKDRGKDDFYDSRDIEDVVTITHGCSQIVAQISAASDDVRKYIAESIAGFLKTPDFLDVLPGKFRGDVDGVRQKAVLARLRKIAEL